jgi:hypothetical protein
MSVFFDFSLQSTNINQHTIISPKQDYKNLDKLIKKGYFLS